MDKTLEMGKISASGSLKLSVGLVASTLIMAAGTIILGRLLSPDEYGLYTIALIPSSTFSLFSDFGVNSAMTKYIAQFRASNKDENARDMIAAGFTFEILTGVTLSFISLFLASFIASTFFHRPESTSLISIASIGIFSGALLTASISVSTGFERMGLNSFANIFQAIFKTGISILLVFLGYGALGVVLGTTLSSLATGIISLILLYLIVLRSFRTRTKGFEIIKNLKTMLHYGVPLSLSTIMAGFQRQFYGFIMAFFCSNMLIGNYHIALNFAVISTFVTTPITTVLFPAFAKINPQNEKQRLKNVFASSIKYTSLLLVPATMAVMLLSQPMINTLFGDKWVYAPLFLTLYIVTDLLVLLGDLIAVSLLRGLGETNMLMKQTVLGLVLGIPAALLLIPTFGIVGALVAGIFSSLPSRFWVYYWIWKHYKAKADFKSSTKIFVASAIAAIITYLSLNFLAAADWIRLIIGGGIFLGIYLFAAPMIGAVNQTDINNLKIMFSGLGIISRLMNIVFVMVERILRTHWSQMWRSTKLR